MGDARILVASLPFAGHVGAMAAVSRELVQRGHDVVVHTGAKYRDKFEGARHLPWTKDWDDAELARTFPAIGAGVTRRKPNGLRQAVDHMLSRPRHRERAQELGARIRAAGGAAIAADLVEELLRRR